MKVTGRLILRNADPLISALAEQTEDVLCDLRQNLAVADSRVFCATRRFLSDYLLPRADEIDDRAGRTFEVVLGRAVHRALSDGATWSMPPVTPDLQGIAATADAPYPDWRLGFWKRALFRRWKEAMLQR